MHRMTFCRRAGRRLGTVALAQVAWLAGCGAGWRHPEIEPAALPPRQQVQVWHGGTAEQWHGLLFAADSISGVPFFRPLTCDSCRAAVARAEVDSIRIGNPMAGFWKTVGLVFGIPTGVFLIACALGECPIPPST